jgi:triacylglycerol esterase/lipase EstA (alpha/beta hydrolase family)
VLDHLAPARRRLVLGVVGLACLAVVAIVAGVVTARLAGSDPPVHPVAQDTQPPVLLVPGYGGGTDDLQPLAAALRAAGRDVSIVPLAGNGTGDLGVQAAVVQNAVRRVAGPGGSVDLVGYSAGGVIVRLWVRDFEGGSVARRIVTLGSPHHGTDLASLATDLAPDRCPAACRQLATGSDLLRSLDHGDETPPGPAWVSIWTADDRVSTPPATAALAGALDIEVQQVCPGHHVTHGQLPGDPVVVAMVLDELRRTPTQVPSASVCVSR